MATFIAIWRQRGGCDYTIGCGVAVHHFTAKDLEAAKRIIINDLSDQELSDETADSISQVEIIEHVGNYPAAVMMPGTWVEERAAKKKALYDADYSKDRAEYERLKKKFEKK